MSDTLTSETSSGNPFKGAGSYTEADKLNFYGRDLEKNEMIRLIAQNTLTLLYSKSGVGKSSLLKAAIIPRLKELKGYLPIYIRISPNMLSEDVPNFSYAVVRLIKEEAAANNIDIEYDDKLLESISPISDFIYLSKFTIKDPSDKKDKRKDEKNEVIPVLVFDQFEEIFSLEFPPEKLKTFLYDIADIVENRIPESLSKRFAIYGPELGEEKLCLLKSKLENTNKWYRVVFSFREEYLPKFESIRFFLPSVFYTNGRQHLETFSINTATEVIQLISGEHIGLEKEMAEKLALLISKKGQDSTSLKQEVQPFLLSLVCKTLYPKLVGETMDHNVVKKVIAQDETLVEEVIGNYANHVFKNVSRKTRVFIEEKLITEDDKRTMKAFNDVKSLKVQKELDILCSNPELRYLNKVEYFDAPHIEVLHDRLLKPAIESRKNRRRTMTLVKVLSLLIGLPAAVILGNSYFLTERTKQSLYKEFFSDFNNEQLDHLIDDSKDNSVKALGNVLEYTSKLKQLPAFKKSFIDMNSSSENFFSEFEDSIAKAFDSTYLYYRHTSSSQNYFSNDGSFRIRDSINKKDTILTFVEIQTDSGFYNHGYIQIHTKSPEPDSEKKNMPLRNYLVEDYSGYRDYMLKFTSSDSIGYIEYGDFLYIYNLKRSEKGKIREIKKVAIKNSRYNFSVDGKFLFIIMYNNKGYSDPQKAETVSIYDLSSSRVHPSIELPYLYSSFIVRPPPRYYDDDTRIRPIVRGFEADDVPPKYYVSSFSYVDGSFHFIYRTKNALISKLISFPGKKEIRIPGKYSNLFANHIVSYGDSAFTILDLNGQQLSNTKTSFSSWYSGAIKLLTKNTQLLFVTPNAEILIYDMNSGIKKEIRKNYPPGIAKIDTSYRIYNTSLSKDESLVLIRYYRYKKNNPSANYSYEYSLELVDLRNGNVKLVANKIPFEFQYAYLGDEPILKLRSYDNKAIIDWYYEQMPPYKFQNLNEFYSKIKKRYRKESEEVINKNENENFVRFR